MRTYEQIMADAKPERPFSNGTMGYGWMGNWCWHPCRKDRNEDCPLIMAAYMGVTPTEWTDQGVQDYHCSEFEPDDEGDDGEPLPDPWPLPVAEIDGQADIFAAFADHIAEQAEQRTAVPA